MARSGVPPPPRESESNNNDMGGRSAGRGTDFLNFVCTEMAGREKEGWMSPARLVRSECSVWRMLSAVRMSSSSSESPLCNSSESDEGTPSSPLTSISKEGAECGTEIEVENDTGWMGVGVWVLIPAFWATRSWAIGRPSTTNLNKAVHSHVQIECSKRVVSPA